MTKRMSGCIIAVAGLCGFWVLKVSPVRAALSSADIQAAEKARVSGQMKKGEEADAKQDYVSAAAAYQEAVEMDPGDAEAHKHFINAAMNRARASLMKLFDNPDYEKLSRGQLHGQAKNAMQAALKKASAEEKAGNDALLATYDRWIAAHPQVAAVYWAKGYLLDMLEKTGGIEELFKKAISLDPKFVPVYNSMAELEFGRGNYARQKDYLKQVMDLDPANAEAAKNYAETFQFSYPTEFRQLAQQYAARFPKDSKCTYMLYQLENTEPTTEDRISVLEAMRRDYVDKPVSTEGMENPDTFTGWLESAMVDLLNLYAQKDLQKALDLAQQMQKQKWADPDWKVAVEYQENLMKAAGLVVGAKYPDALTLLQKPFTAYLVTRELDHAPASLAEAEALAGDGKVQRAFDTLAADWIKAPNPELKAGLLRFGAKLGENSEQVDDAVWQKWTASAKTMKPFKLMKTDKSGRVKLSDFRGKVILVDFWFPLCGPCRGEMPYLNQVAKKYQPQGFEILAINGIPDQDSLAPGVLKNYDIVGLQVPSNKWAVKYDNVRGYPTNYLLDRQGRILAHPDVRSVDALKVLETQIDYILARSSKN